MSSINLLTRRKRLLVFGFVIVATLVTFIVSPVETQHERGISWVLSHPSAQPSTLQELAAYPEAYRPTIFRSLEPVAQSRLWREQLLEFLKREQTITAAQRASVSEVIDRLDPALFMLGLGDDLCRKMSEALGDRASIIAARNIAKFATPKHTWRSRMLSVTERLHGVRAGLLEHLDVHASFPTCDCNGLGWCEGCGIWPLGPSCEENGDQHSWWHCKPGGICGCLTSLSCNGRCDGDHPHVD